MKKLKKAAFLILRIEETFKNWVEECAALLGEDKSEFTRTALKERCEKVSGNKKRG